MKFPSKEQLAALRRRYPAGMLVELLSMDDCQSPPVGTIGKVMGVDDAGSIMVRWRTGSTLSLIPGEDSFRIVEGDGNP